MPRSGGPPGRRSRLLRRSGCEGWIGTAAGPPSKNGADLETDRPWAFRQAAETYRPAGWCSPEFCWRALKNIPRVEASECMFYTASLFRAESSR